MKPLAKTHHRPQPSFMNASLKPQSPPHLGDPPVPMEPMPPNPAFRRSPFQDRPCRSLPDRAFLSHRIRRRNERELSLCWARG